MTISASARAERRGVGLLALVSIGILFATLVLGARVSPARAVDNQASCERPLDIILVIDRSGSMAEETGGQSRLDWAKQAANDLVDGLDAHGGVGAGGLHQVGVTTYGGTTASIDLALGGSSAAAAHAAINGSSPNSWTPLKLGMATAAGDMGAGHARDAVDGVSVTQVLILLSDGRPVPDPGQRPSGSDISAFQGAADQVFAVAIGPVGGSDITKEPDLALMNNIANPSGSPDGSGDFTGGNYRHVLDAQSLPNLFGDIADELLCGDIQISKTPDPAGPVDPATQVTYSYSVWNDGDTPLSSVVVTDDTCAPVSYVSGDDGDNLLEHGEIWSYQCSMPLDKTTTNTACADGDFIGGGSDSACADATVEVNPPKEPAIQINKSSDADGSVLPGTLVTYTYEVTNTGNTPLSNVAVTDLISGSDAVACAVDSSAYTGDANDNGILDIGETWTFTCSTALQVTTANEACVVADIAAGQDVRVAAQQVNACDEEKVEVSQSPEQSVEAGTGTPVESQPDTSLSGSGGGVLPTILFSLILVTSLGALAFANVRAMRRLS